MKSGEFSPETARHLREAFDLRQKCDYREFFEPDESQAREVTQYAEDFIEEAGQLWQTIRDAGS